MTELNAATGALVKVLKGPSYGFNDPSAVASDGTHVWVTNYGGTSVTELDAATGALVRVSARAELRIQPSRRGRLRRHPRLGGQPDGTFGDRDGRRHRGPGQGTASSSYGFNGPGAVASDGTHVWVANAAASVTELDTADRGPGQRAQRPELRVHGSRRHRLGRHPPLGGQLLPAAFGDRAERRHRGAGPGAERAEIWVQGRRRRRPDGTHVWVAN